MQTFRLRSARLHTSNFACRYIHFRIVGDPGVICNTVSSGVDIVLFPWWCNDFYIVCILSCPAANFYMRVADYCCLSGVIVCDLSTCLTSLFVRLIVFNWNRVTIQCDMQIFSMQSKTGEWTACSTAWDQQLNRIVKQVNKNSWA